MRYLRPTAEIAPRALLPGDPGRALALAQDLLDKPLMSNHSRGLWGYFGQTEAGEALTIQATGIGGPSAVAILRELVALGVKRAVRVGTCVGVDPGLRPGDVLVVEDALALDGASRALGFEGEHVREKTQLSPALREGAPGCTPATVATVDVVPAELGALRERGPSALDLATAPLMVLGDQLGVEVGALLVVGMGADGSVARDEQVEERTLEAGRVAAAALARS